MRIPEVSLKKVEPLIPRLAYEYRATLDPAAVRRIEKEIGTVYLMQIDPSGRAWSLGLDPSEQSGMANLTRGDGWTSGEEQPEPEKVGFETNEVRNKRLFGIG